MYSQERTAKILEILKKRKRISTKELASLTHYSLSTLRRDLLTLEKDGLLRRVHGGVEIRNTTNNELADTYRESENIKEKQYICDIAKDFIGSGMCLFLDSSSTVLQLCTALETYHNMILLTNGLKTAIQIGKIQHETLKVFVTGGELKCNSSSLVEANLAEQMIDSFKINLAICSCQGIDIDGVYEASLDQAMIKKKIMSKADKVILLVDYQKFGQSHFFKIGDLNNYEAIITNKKPSQEFLDFSQDNSVDFLW